MRMFHNMLCSRRCSVASAGVVPAAWGETGLVHARSVQVTHIATGAQMSASKLRRFLLIRCAVCMVVVLLLPAQGLCTMPTPRCSLCVVASTQTHACAQHVVHLRWSCSCLRLSESVVCIEACTGFVQHGNTGTGCKACLTASTHANRHASIY
jgi:hypothetical protein